MRVIRALCPVLIMVLAAASCGLVGDDTDQAADLMPFDAVLVELFGTTDTDAYLATAERQADEFVVECMAEAGFVYEIPPAPLVPDEPDDDLAYAESEGFGIVSNFRRQISDTDFDFDPGVDPNELYFASLRPSERARFITALNGDDVEPGQLQTTGCIAVGGQDAYADWNRFFRGLANFTVLAEERDTHPDWVAARLIWRDCMAERGFDYSEPEAIRSDVLARMRDSVSKVYPGGQLPLIETADGFELDPAVDELLDTEQQFEIAAAVADFACTEPVADQFDAVEREVQQAFVDRHQVTIDVLLDLHRSETE